MDRSRLAARLAELADAHATPGAQFAVHHDGRTWTWERGEVRAGSRVPMTPDSPVPIGSVTKAVTATAAMVLVGDGDLDLDEPVADQVPDLRALPGPLRARLTPRHLLGHTGGLPADHPEVRAATARRHVLDCCRGADPLAEPGQLFSYSNVGYLLVGHVVGAVTGMGWAEAVEALVLGPAGVPARFAVGDDVADGLVSGHSVRGGVARPVAQSLSPVEAPAGALAASAADLVRFGRALLDPDGPLEPGARKEMTTAVPGAEPFGLADGWGLGLARYGPGGATVGHDGTGDGTSCHLRVNTATGTVVALTANASTGFALWRELAPLLPGLGVPVADYDPLSVAGGPLDPPADCLGEYANGDVGYVVARAGGGLRLTVDGEPFADLTVYSGLRFLMRDCGTGAIDQAGRFVSDRDGRVLGLQVGGRLARKRVRARSVA